MKVIVIGATGTIGSAVVEQLGQRHDIVGVGTRSGQYQADIADIAQVRALFERFGKVDAVVVAAGALQMRMEVIIFAPPISLVPAALVSATRRQTPRSHLPVEFCV
ncbi:NAD-dependent epimerase/dehydratase family protein [Oxalobacteraceae bacterium OTU3CINTB1]|nr:NAD-dependent epimerase/dehydratase family protein [Oxalobacteraceae bacterium OTU3CINTB1]